MNREIALKQLAELAESWDTETAHSNADQVLCDLLKALGYEDVVLAYNKVSKWYA